MDAVSLSKIELFRIHMEAEDAIKRIESKISKELDPEKRESFQRFVDRVWYPIWARTGDKLAKSE